MRRRVFAALCLVCLIAAAAAVASAALRSRAANRPASPAAQARALRTLRAPGPKLVFRALDRSAPGRYGRLAVAPLRGEAAGSPASSGMTCDRTYFAGGRGLCLTPRRTFPTPSYEIRFLDASLRVVHRLKLPGVPSRARVSADGRYGASTVFVSGHSYASSAGAFSTATQIYDMATGRALGNLEAWPITRDGREIDAPDFNFWGVTFDPRDTDRFYATLATGGRTYLVRGSVRGRRMQTIHTNVECPSISPDGTRIGFKKLVGKPALWRFTVLDLRTGRETALAETRSVDDQLAWLDDGHVLYRVGEELVTVPADGSGAPRVFLPAADSPAVVG